MADAPRLYFTIGPVQTFVAQSRRTRDLWASSYLLSHLADTAMTAVENAGGRIVLPFRKDDGDSEPSPLDLGVRHGRWPNRFIAAVDDGKSAADMAADALKHAWRKIADAVWSRYVENAAAKGNGTRAIWDRQVENFWEISWIIASPPAAGDPRPLALRKALRTAPATIEPGDHCAMMGNWQELSGHLRSAERRAFWTAVRGSLGELNLRENEQLCAPALIKRAFPLIGQQTMGTDLHARRWLSTPYIAAIPWLKRVCRRHASAANDYLKVVKRHRGQEGWRREEPGGIQSLRPLLDAEGGEFLRLDADFVHETALANKKDTPLDADDDDAARAEVLDALDGLQKKVGRSPSSFYALLLMDGDSLGKLLAEARASRGEQGEAEVTRALGRFADRVPDTVGRHDGAAVYCGGDDVLAMLPVARALPCALELSTLFRGSFGDVCDDAFAARATISGAIVFCPFRAPLREVLAIAHRLLDDVAKNQTGRDSLAVAVFKSSGITCQWSAPWNHLRRDGTTIMALLANRIRGRGKTPGALSSSFLFQIRQRYSSLTDDPLVEPGRFGRLAQGIDPRAILLAEYLRARTHRDDAEARSTPESIDDANDAIDLLLKACRRVRRIDGKVRVDDDTLGIDGALLARFLADESEEDEP